MKRLFCLFLMVFCMLSTLPAMADVYVYAVPGEEDVQQEEAVEIALSFLEETLGFSRLAWPAEVRSIYFGPGDQWLGKTSDNCWIISLHNAMPLQATVQVHGETGEIVSWECRGDEKLTDIYSDVESIRCQSFMDVLPKGKEWLNAQALYQRAMADFSYHSDISLMELEKNATASVAYGRADHNGWLVLEEEKEGEAIDFCIYCTLCSDGSTECEKWFYNVVYSMENGEILDQYLSCNEEERPFHMNPPKQ